ncbi:hypothetical protein MMC09_006887 [Bachmanniomyces sp. S44760]|nr:hypothetical protein [Bachmanniomyces sp. S44760]
MTAPSHHICGCFYTVPHSANQYLPQVKLDSKTAILSSASCTCLTQTFLNPTEAIIKDCIYTFPLYDGVSVVDFTCRIGQQVVRGVVKERNHAQNVYEDAKGKGKTASLLEQSPAAADCFTIKLGILKSKQRAIVEITYLGELKHDSELDATRFTIPTTIAPRYGSKSGNRIPHAPFAYDNGSMSITVDVFAPKGVFIKRIASLTHQSSTALGITSDAPLADSAKGWLDKVSATLTLDTCELEKDFVLLIETQETGIPKAILETHPTIPDQRALMVTLVPKFSLTPSRPEIIFVADQSGSMHDKIPALMSAMKIFLKSLPLGIKFNILSYGTKHSLLWPQSKAYSHESLSEAIAHVEDFSASMEGTETFAAIKAAINSRHEDLPCEVMLLTDGQIWKQEKLFSYIGDQVTESNGEIRVFALGIGDAVSSSLIEGVARAGNGLAQIVSTTDQLDAKIIRMLKAGLSPHVKDYTLELNYSNDEDHGKDKENEDEDEEENFYLVENITDGVKFLLENHGATEKSKGKESISLYDKSSETEKALEPTMSLNNEKDRYAHLPEIPIPYLLQAPHKVPALFPFTRTAVYVLMSPGSDRNAPKSVTLRGSSVDGPVHLKIPVESLPIPGTTIHQLAAKKAAQDLEEGRGWLHDAKDENGDLIKHRYPGRFDEIVEREAVRLGVQFQVAGKWSSFVAVASNDTEDHDMVKDEDRIKVLIPEAENRNKSGDQDSPPDHYRYAAMSNLVLQADARHVSRRPTIPEPTSPKPVLLKKEGAVARSVAFEAGKTDSSRSPSGPASPIIPTVPKSLPTTSKVHAIIALQDFAGFWKMSHELSTITGIPEKKFSDPVLRHCEKTRWITILIIVWLDKKMKDQEAVWELVVEKARDWLRLEECVDKDVIKKMEHEALDELCLSGLLDKAETCNRHKGMDGVKMATLRKGGILKHTCHDEGGENKRVRRGSMGEV